MDSNSFAMPKSRVRKAKNTTSGIGRWNGEMLRRLTHALKDNPEADMVALLTSSYSKKLESFKAAAGSRTDTVRTGHRSRDIRSHLSSTDPCTVMFKLSAELEALLPNRLSLAQAIVDLLAGSSVLYKSDWAANVMVFKLNESIVVKVTNDEAVATEHASLAYIHEHLPNFLAPKPHGLVRLGQSHLLFTSLVPGRDLEKVWPELSNEEKQSVADQLGTLFTALRSLKCPDAAPLGSVLGVGCRDLRRDVRLSEGPIMTDQQFQEFLFAGSKTASTSYTRLLQSLLPPTQAKVVFTHGDVRPANIIVQKDEKEGWKIRSIIDWEASGFYPEYWECIKTTNNLMDRDGSDWYSYLPQPLSPSTYPSHWLIDRVWDRSLGHS